MACGLLEAAKYVGTDEAAEYTKLAAHYFRDRWGKKEPNDR